MRQTNPASISYKIDYINEMNECAIKMMNKSENVFRTIFPKVGTCLHTAAAPQLY